MINDKGVELIKFYEALRLTAYLCPAGVPTIGWGHTKTVTMADVRARKTITEAEANELFVLDVEDHEAPVRQALKRHANDNMLAAMVSLAFNIGGGAIKTCSVMKLHNMGNFVGAHHSFILWDKIRNPRTGQLEQSSGLLKRRQKEAALYLLPV